MIIINAIVEWAIQARPWEIYLAATAIAALLSVTVRALAILAKRSK